MESLLTDHLMRIQRISDRDSAVADSELLASLKKSNNAALTEILRRYESPILGYLAHLLGDEELAKDLTQDTFLTLIQRPPFKTHQGSLKPWLFRVARNKAFDFMRKEQRLVSVETIPEGHSEAEGKQTTEEEVRPLLESLSPELKEVVLLRIYADLKFSEIAKELKIPLGTALWRMQQALKAMRKSLTKADLK